MTQNVSSGINAPIRAPLSGEMVVGEVFGGLAAMLVALPSAIAFGLLVYSPLGRVAAAQGAMAGILGAIVLGLVAPVLGGTPRLISAPCAPAAAVLTALVAEAITPRGGQLSAELIGPLIMLVVLLAGAMQFLFGTVGGGKLIKYIPYPVVAGYLSGVGVLIFVGQLPKFIGLPKEVPLVHGLVAPSLWSTPALVIGVVTILVMVFAPRITRALPAAILALVAGITAYFVVGIVSHPELLTLTGNKLVIGAMHGVGGGSGILDGLTARFSTLSAFISGGISLVLVPAATLAVLLSIDTLKTCVIVDALTRSRHDSNRELIGQGVANALSGLAGGLAGAGTMGATLVNLSSGGKTRLSGVLTGVFSVAALVIFGNLVAWVPLPALAGILLVVGTRMVDRRSFRLLLNRSTMLDFLVIAAVVAAAVTIGLIAAAGVGLGLAILLFLREQIRGSVVRRSILGNQAFSKKRRLPAEMSVLEAKGGETAIFELQGSLFFGTTDQLFVEIAPYLAKCKYIILDMKRVQSVDFTATHLLEQLEDRITERGGWLLFADLPASLPTRQDLRAYFDQVGLVRPKGNLKIFAALDDAIEWTEDRVLEEDASLAHLSRRDEAPLEIGEIDLLSSLPPMALSLLEKCAEKRAVAKDQKIFSQGDTGDELFLVRKGDVRIMLPVGANKSHHLATFGRGDFFGDMSFLDRGSRSADAVASSPCELFVLSRAAFERFAAEQPRVEAEVFARLARALALRLRATDTELRALEQA